MVFESLLFGGLVAAISVVFFWIGCAKKAAPSVYPKATSPSKMSSVAGSKMKSVSKSPAKDTEGDDEKKKEDGEKKEEEKKDEEEDKKKEEDDKDGDKDKDKEKEKEEKKDKKKASKSVEKDDEKKKASKSIEKDDEKKEEDDKEGDKDKDKSKKKKGKSVEKDEDKKEEKKEEEEGKKEEGGEDDGKKKEAQISANPMELRFETIKTSQKKLQLKNLTDKKLMFKIKASTTSAFLINPVFGKIEPNKFAEVMITHRPSEKRDDKMVIITADFSGKEHEIAKTFKTAKPSGPDVTVKLISY